MKALFDAKEVKTLLTALPANAEVTLVGDQGVYLMSFAQDKEKRTIVYAKGCNPDKDEDFYDNKVKLFGGDDGGDTIGSAGSLLEMFSEGEVEKFFVNITPSSLGAGVVFAPDLKAFAEWQLGILAKLRAIAPAALATKLAWYQNALKVGTAKDKKTARHIIPMIKSVIKERANAWAAKTEPCASCKNGKQKITVNEVGVGKSSSVVEIECGTCKGKGTVPLGFNAKLKAAEEAFWCKCGKSDTVDATFHDDGECRDCQKHHYHCGVCNKISQVG